MERLRTWGSVPESIWDSIALGLAALAGSYAIARAIGVPLTYDEAAAYLRYVDAHPLAVLDFSVATNHLLHTILVKLCSAAAGSGEFALRLPALAGFVLFAAFAWLLLRRLRHRALATAAFVLLVANPYLLDYFSLSRGYGLSLGLLSGALYFLARFVADASAPRDRLVRSLLFATAAALANFSLLNAFAAIWLAAFGIVLARRRLAVAPPVFEAFRFFRPRGVFALVAAASAALLWSQDPGLSPALYEPVSVRVLNADAAPAGSVRVYRVDATGRTEALRQIEGEWRLARGAPFYGLRVETSAGLDPRLEVLVGDQVFRDDRGARGLWHASEEAAVRVFDSTPLLSLNGAAMPAFRRIVNWRGGLPYVLQIARMTGVTLIALACLAVLLDAAGWLMSRRRLVIPADWRALANGALWTAALTGVPLYILARNGELYYGGTAGLAQDTFYSIIRGWLYGLTYHPNQTPIAFAGALATVAFSGAAVALGYGRRSTPATIAATLLAILLAASAIAVVQHALLGTPYPLGRTALYFVPLFVLFVACAVDAVAAASAWARAGVAAVLALLVAASLYHFAEAANVSSVLDWPQDASTPRMMTDLREDAAGRSSASLGVEWVYYPVAEYYARRQPLAIEVHVLPKRGGTDYAYGDERTVGGEVVGRYELTRTVLVRSR